MVDRKNVLLVTAYQEGKRGYDYWMQNVNRHLRYSVHKSTSHGLRFLKKNIPDLTILENPSFTQYVQELEKGYDVVGFSFYTFEIPKILKMVRMARFKGVPELWAGNYGALTYGMEKYFDKIHTGYGEHWIADQLGISIVDLKHPVITETINFPLGVRAFPVGTLITSRGCTNNCSFCQSPVFSKHTSTIPLKSIEDIIKTYNDMGLTEIIISDENFGLHKKHSESVIEILSENGMNWYPMTRVDILHKRLDEWIEMGMVGTLLGIESLRQSNLNGVGKDFKVEMTENLLAKLKENNIFTVGYYIIGFEDDTEKSVKESMTKIGEYSIDMLQVCILTPLPRTPLWGYLDDKYGIFEKDWSKWDTKHLVWNHPNFSPQDLHELLRWSNYISYPNKNFFKTPAKHFHLRKKRHGIGQALHKTFTDVAVANTRFKGKIPP